MVLRHFYEPHRSHRYISARVAGVQKVLKGTAAAAASKVLDCQKKENNVVFVRLRGQFG